MTEKIPYIYKIDYIDGHSTKLTATHHEKKGSFPHKIIRFYNKEELVAEVQEAQTKGWSKEPIK